MKQPVRAGTKMIKTVLKKQPQICQFMYHSLLLYLEGTECQKYLGRISYE